MQRGFFAGRQLEFVRVGKLHSRGRRSLQQKVNLLVREETRVLGSDACHLAGYFFVTLPGGGITVVVECMEKSDDGDDGEAECGPAGVLGRKQPRGGKVKAVRGENGQKRDGNDVIANECGMRG